jgi:hypothetical protein
MGSFPHTKRPEREGYHSRRSNVEVNNMWRCISTPTSPYAFVTRREISLPSPDMSTGLFRNSAKMWWELYSWNKSPTWFNQFIDLCWVLYYRAVAYRGGRGLGGPKPPNLRTFDKAEPNSQFRGKYIRDNLIRIRVSLICKLSETPD